MVLKRFLTTYDTMKNILQPSQTHLMVQNIRLLAPLYPKLGQFSHTVAGTIAINNQKAPDENTLTQRMYDLVFFRYIFPTNVRIYGHQGLLCGIQIFQLHHTI